MSATVSDKLLAWYDAHARDLPWRAQPGANAADPYRVWLSEVMLQQTTVAAVRPRFEAWVARWPTLAALAAASDADVMAAWAGLGYYARARNLLQCARAVVAEHDSAFPTAEAELRALPGLGDYTAAAIAAIAFGRRAVVIDANVKRVVARLFADDGATVRALADRLTPDARTGDFAQAMMDLGSAICTPRAPKCLLCPLRDDCAGFASGMPEAFPAKAVKKAKPQRHGTAFWLTRGRDVLLVRRPPSGLLGGMRALPSGHWTEDASDRAGAPVDAAWRDTGRSVTHVFTHFRLELRLASAEIDAQDVAGQWWPIDDLDSAGLPTVFAKAAARMKE
ncbi:A/G-specific adenine glycosylase [Sphingomonas sp.]|uniref:A/G-specific adenine glycosylase n=1 Tax=Sphingomonas sp. TaxID=28214 RepID=UPI002DD66179|nr:A/G-specific adenine glycosylase [Sphingomonas sp.]